MIFFFIRCNHQIRLFHIPKMVDRFFRYCQSSRLLIMEIPQYSEGTISTPLIRYIFQVPTGKSVYSYLCS